MSTQTVIVERKLTRYFPPDRNPHESFNIAMHAALPSDANRIFQALTQPEYMETWLTFPGDDAASHLVARQQNNGFCLDHYRNESRDLVVSGDYRICRRRKMLFTWKKHADDAPAAESLVYIRLHGNFTNTIVELHHRGIAAPPEYAWQQAMWQASFARLTRLFQS